MIIDYCKDGEAVGDFSAIEYVTKKFEQYPGWHIHTSSECVIQAARVLVKQGKIPHDQVEYRHEHEFVSKPNRDANLRNWPVGFCDFFDKCFAFLAGWTEEAPE